MLKIVATSLMPFLVFCSFDGTVITGSDREIDVIDVSRQCDLKMRLGDFVEYYNSPNRDKVLNVISLEFSETRYTNISILIVLTV